MRTFSLLLLLIIAVCSGSAQRQRTTVKGPLQPIQSVGTSNTKTAPGNDTIRTNVTDYIRLSGYDKPATATRETMHVTNLSDTLTITGVTVEIQYLDKQRRELHRREVTLYPTILPHETQLVAFPSWDIQHSFYYLLSIKPRRQATPYDVHCTALTIITKSNN